MILTMFIQCKCMISRYFVNVGGKEGVGQRDTTN